MSGLNTLRFFIRVPRAAEATARAEERDVTIVPPRSHDDPNTPEDD